MQCSEKPITSVSHHVFQNERQPSHSLSRCPADSWCKHNPDAWSLMLTPLARRPWASLGHHHKDNIRITSPHLCSFLPPFPLVCLPVHLSVHTVSSILFVQLPYIMYTNAFWTRHGQHARTHKFAFSHVMQSHPRDSTWSRPWSLTLVTYIYPCPCIHTPTHSVPPSASSACISLAIF